MFSEPKHKPRAELNGNKITIYPDAKTAVTRAVRESDKEDWPDLFKAKKRGRPKKVTNEHQGDSESSPE